MHSLHAVINFQYRMEQITTTNQDTPVDKKSDGKYER